MKELSFYEADKKISIDPSLWCNHATNHSYIYFGIIFGTLWGCLKCIESHIAKKEGHEMTGKAEEGNKMVG